MTNDEYYYPQIKDVRVEFYFPAEVVEASLVSSFPGLKESHLTRHSSMDGSWMF